MYDCFNMAYQDNANAIHLNIKVNSENLLPIPQKYNAGSLRIPADPSWPKIPQRKLVDDVDDTIVPPCIVTLTGTPRRSRTVVQAPLNQSPKSTLTKDSAHSSFHQQRVASSMHTLKKLPGYVDPRFKKVTSVKRNQVTSMESLEEKAVQPDVAGCTELWSNGKLGKPIPKRDTNAQQVKLEEERLRITRRNEEVNAKSDLSPQIPRNSDLYGNTNKCIRESKENKNFNINEEVNSEQKHCINNSESKNVGNVSEDNGRNEITEKDKCMKNTSCYEYMQKLGVNDANTQDNNGQLFFVLDKKFQPHPLNAIHLDTITIPQEYVNQCYNVKVPVLTYKNIPMQIPPSAEANNAAQQCPNPCLTKNEAGQCAHPPNTELLNQFTQITSNKMQNMLKPLNNGNAYLKERIFSTFIFTCSSYYIILDTGKQIAGNRNICDSGKNIVKLQNSGPAESKDQCSKPHDNVPVTSASRTNASVPNRLECTKVQRQQESSDSEYYIPTVIKKSVHSNAFQRLNAKKAMYNTSGDETTDSEFITQKSVQKKELIGVNKLTLKANRIKTNMHGDVNSVHEPANFVSKERNEYLESVPPANVVTSDQDQPYQERKGAVYETQTRNKSEQNLPSARSECVKKLCRNSEPHITFKQKKATTKFSRKARSYFQKNPHPALADSDYTLVWPNCQSNRHKCSQMNIHKFNNYRTRKIGRRSNAKLPLHDRNATARIDNGVNFVEQKYLQDDQDMDSCQEMIKVLSKSCLQMERCKCDMSPGTNTDDTIERPKGISPKTQELLNKSYWEYYNKLRHKIQNTGSMERQYLHQLAMDTPEAKKRKTDELYDKELQAQSKLNPELQTLQQCSALSSMINKALDSNLQSDIAQTKQLCRNGSTNASPDPDAPNVNAKKVAANLTDTEPMFDKSRYNRNTDNDKKFLELKSIIFFGGMLYILIILLPMLYDYFYHEEYDHYEDLSYLELIMEYVLSSFKEAFGGALNGVKQIFFYPVLATVPVQMASQFQRQRRPRQATHEALLASRL
ncbi:uncharacterized protein LOC143368104 isoform X2 [Andrena cerasifolii]|uniref:uncharacterized protein LOC143368104 isoform X2 n=1 Tax=Andrena cerasifolii TaxID=2819439 RepID=UPI004037AE3D